jgi:type VI secretion system secreted protein VgrG
MSTLELSFASGDHGLSVRRFTAHEAVSTLFAVTVWARSPDASIDLESLVGQEASLHAVSGYANAAGTGVRRWSGIVDFAEQVQAEAAGLSTYRIRIVPRLWLLTQRRGNRIYQHLTIPEIIDKLLAEWGIDHRWEIDQKTYPQLEYKVQYGESDYAFFSRLLEEAGVAFTFPEDDHGSKLVLGDRLHGAPPRSAPPIGYRDEPPQAAEKEFVTRVRIGHEVRPGAQTNRDYDFRNPALPPEGAAPKSDSPEDFYEQYHYRPGAFLAETGRDAGTPAADDRGFNRYDIKYGTEKATRELLGSRMGREGFTFESNAVDLWPGTVFQMAEHPKVELDESRRLLVISLSIEAVHDGEWLAEGHAVFTEVPYRPPHRTHKPQILGVQSAVVVGPSGQEIHTDEFGRVRIQLPWDREGKLDDGSSCWIRVSQGWGGTGYGMITLPRIGQEVLVSFLDGDPDLPILTGRVFNQTNPVPYKLPENKTISTWKSDSSEGSNGFNEIKFEDKKTDELFYVQAEHNLRKLVKNDETITVAHDRAKHIANVETDTTVVNRTEVTGVNRTEVNGMHRATLIVANRAKLTRGNQVERTMGRRYLQIEKNLDSIIKGKRREHDDSDVHQYVKGSRREHIVGDQSLTVGMNQYEHVAGSHALETGGEIHFAAHENLMGEGASDVTLKGPGGFIRIDAAGITISGMVVKINAGGSAGQGPYAHPEEPAQVAEAEPKEPDPIPTDVVVHKAPGKTTVVQPAPIKPKERTALPSTETPVECELASLEIECEHPKHKVPIKLPAAKDAKKPFDVLEVIAGGKGDGDTITAKIVMAKPRCATTHKGQALAIHGPGGRVVKAEDTSTFEVVTHDIDIRLGFFAHLWPWNRAPEVTTVTALACHEGGLVAKVHAFPDIECKVDLSLALNTAARVKTRIKAAQEKGKVETRGRPAQTDWSFTLKGSIRYGTQTNELSAKYEDKVKEWASFNLLVKRAIDKFCELFYTFTGVTVLPEFPNLSLSYSGKFKELDAKYQVGPEWKIVLKADPLIGLTFQLDILDVMITALEKTQFAVIARFLKKVRGWCKDRGQKIEITLSFTGTIGGEVGAKKPAAEPKAGPYGMIEGKLKVEFAAKCSFGSQGWVGFAFGAEAKANSGIAARLMLDHNATGLFLKGKLILLACKFQYSAFASGKVVWEIKESYGGEYMFWDDIDMLKSPDVYVLKNA